MLAMRDEMGRNPVGSLFSSGVFGSSSTYGDSQQVCALHRHRISQVSQYLVRLLSTFSACTEPVILLLPLRTRVSRSGHHKEFFAL